jgi:class 3 adenylate cyclase/tetratricopeptide (TPR) repeat protein
MDDTTQSWVALNADVVGYSALVADDVEATSEAMDATQSIVRRRVEKHGGTLASFVGDSFMAIFPGAIEGLRAAVAITRDVEERNEGLPASRGVRFRMGMDQGEVRFADGNHHGDALNIAARIQAIAPVGGVAVSGRVHQALDEPTLRFRAMGRQKLKNIPERVGVYELVGLPSSGRDRRADRLAMESPSLAVLPIHADTLAEEVRPVAEMIRHDLIHRLSALPDLKLIDALSESRAGVERAANYMLETGAHQFGDRVRVFAALIDLSTMNIVKSHRWTVPVAELFELSEQLAEDVARSVEVDLVVGEPARLYADLEDPEAIENVYLGWYHLRNYTAEGWERALERFGSVMRSHPDLPYGYVLSAFAQWLGAANGFAQDAQSALTRALELSKQGEAAGDPTGMAQAVEAAVLMSRGECDAALARVDQLEITRPTCDITYGLEGSIRRYLGQWERAVELMDKAMRLTGINKPWYPTVKACSLFVGGRNEEAASLAEAVLEHQPGNLEALLVLAGAQAELGLSRRSRATLQLVRARFPAVDVDDWLEKTPFQRREVVSRWKQALDVAGALER